MASDHGDPARIVTLTMTETMMLLHAVMSHRGLLRDGTIKEQPGDASATDWRDLEEKFARLAAGMPPR